jgi:hypothetical protein
MEKPLVKTKYKGYLLKIITMIEIVLVLIMSEITISSQIIIIGLKNQILVNKSKIIITEKINDI